MIPNTLYCLVPRNDKYWVRGRPVRITTLFIFLFLFCSSFANGKNFEELSPVEILLKCYEYKNNGHCDSLIFFLNENIERLRTDDSLFNDRYSRALGLLVGCYEQLEKTDSAELTMRKQLDYITTKKGVKSDEYENCLTGMIHFYVKQQNHDKLIESWMLKLNPERYDLQNKDEKSSYTNDFEIIFIDGKEFFSGNILGIMPLEQLNLFEDAMKRVVGGNDYGLELLQGKMKDLLALQPDREREEAYEKELVQGALLTESFEYVKKEEYEKAIELLTTNFNIFVPGTTKYDGAMATLSDCYSKLGQTDRAEALLLQLKDEKAKEFGKQSWEYESSVYKLITFYRDHAFLAKETDLRQMWLTEKNYDMKDDVNRISYQNQLFQIASNFGQMNDFGNYLAYKDTLAAFYLQYITDPGFEDGYIQTLLLLQFLYHETNDYEKALQLSNQLIDFITSRQLENQYKEEYEQTMWQRASLYEYQINDKPKAIDAYIELKDYFEKQQNNVEIFRALNSLYFIYYIAEDLDNQEKTAVQLVEKTVQHYSKNHIEYGEAIKSLAIVYNRKDDYSRTIELLTEAKNLKSIYLDNNRENSYISILELLGEAKALSGRMEEAENEFEESQHYWNDFIFNDLLSSSTEVRQALWDHYSPRVSIGSQFAYLYQTDWLYKMSYNNELMSKGLLLRTANAIRSAVLSSNDKTLITNWEELTKLREQIERMKTGKDSDEETLRDLEKKARTLDYEITRASADYRDLKADLTMTWQEVQKQLKSDEAAIEFINFRARDRQWDLSDTMLYAALVLRPGMNAPAWVSLCEQKQLEAILRVTIESNTQLKTENLYVDKGSRLYDVAWKPLEELLQDVKTVYYSPSGLLHKIAFNALPANNENVLLSDKHDLLLVSSTREIARLKQEKASTFVRDSTVVYGGLTYDRRQLSQAAAEKRIVQPNEQPSDNDDRFVDRFRKRSAELPPADLRAGFSEWQHLPGTKRETEEIVKLLTDRRVPYQYYIEDKGTEESFKELSRTDTKIIFLGTHGFFLADLENKLVENIVRRLGGGKDKPFENPMLRSGLIMSGANEQWLAKEYIMDDDREDGILTADEISRLNLIKTNLVVLSACETGLGDVKNSEGVFGLQRAFKLAGVESLIMSLWQVPDIATADLMTTFYKLWLSGQTKQSAFRTAQQKVREKYQSPYYWAAFVIMD